MRSFAFIWDLDGTLVDSYPSIIPAAQEVCATLGLSCCAEEIYAYSIRFSVGAFLEKVTAELGIDPAPVKARFNALNDARIDRIQPNPHAVETLAALRRDGHQSFLYTHRGASCGAILENTGLSSCFAEVLTALNGFPRKPAPDGIVYLMQKHGLRAERCFYVGDRSLDVLAAKNEGIGSILYLPSKSRTELTGHETYVVRELLEIPDLVNTVRS